MDTNSSVFVTALFLGRVTRIPLIMLSGFFIWNALSSASSSTRGLGCALWSFSPLVLGHGWVLSADALSDNDSKANVPNSVKAASALGSGKSTAPAPHFNKEVPIASAKSRQGWIRSIISNNGSIVRTKMFDLKQTSKQARSDPVPVDNHRKPRKVETRVLQMDANGRVFAATYVWNTSGTEANLSLERFEIDLHADNKAARISVHGTSDVYRLPGFRDCLVCHNRDYQVLGINAAQLNRSVNRAGELVAISADDFSFVD